MELDRLYATILSVYPHWETMKIVLGGLINTNLTTIKVVFGVDLTEIILVLDALSSLINIVLPNTLSDHEHLLIPIFGLLFNSEDKISFCHLSFLEFLEDKRQSGPYYVDSCAFTHKVTDAFFAMVHHNLDTNYETEPHLSL